MILEDNMGKEKSFFEWCYVNEIKPLDISDYDDFILGEMTYEEFKEYLEKGNFEKNSLPVKPEKFLEYRMYGLVPYNISDIQKGIQYDHAKDNYSIEYGSDERYKTFIKEWKTSIILNGGTSNEGHMIRQGFKDSPYIGTMQEHLSDLKTNGVKVSTFYEPDLNSMLTAIVFLVDERVFNKRLYPDYKPLKFEGGTNEEMVEWSIDDIKRYNKWVTSIGGPINVFLRDFLGDKKLA